MGGRMRHRRARGHFVLALALGAVGLGNANCGKSSPPAVGAPSNLTYSASSATYTRGAAIVADTPSSTGGAVASYSVSPPLPAGLDLNVVSGVISGTPSVVSAALQYTVMAT